MQATKSDIIARLQQEILPLQGLKGSRNPLHADLGLGEMVNAFANKTFPLGAVHEFINTDPADTAATAGFICAITGKIMRGRGVAMWIGMARTLFPAAMIQFGLDPSHMIFIELNREKDVLWAMEEALKCDALTAVVCEASDISFIASRRLQLAVEKSCVTGFVLRRNPRQINVTACVTRWKVTSCASEAGDLPGVGFPIWNVELLKVRNGIPGSWHIQWNGEFEIVRPAPAFYEQGERKTG